MNLEEIIPKGIRLTSGSVSLMKTNKLIGISIGGGRPFCPSFYIVQITEGSIVDNDGTLEAGDEIISINGILLKEYNRNQVAKLIHETEGKLMFNYNKLHLDKVSGYKFEIASKKLKHRIVENMNTSVADALGLSRAVLINDSMVKEVKVIDRKAMVIRIFIQKILKYIKANQEINGVYKDFSELLLKIGVRESQVSANEAFCRLGQFHKVLQKSNDTFIKSLTQIMEEYHTFIKKTIPDMKSTLSTYLDSKFEYLSFCLKIKEMDDEEYAYAAMKEPLYRVETGNYEYRILLRFRQMSRKKFCYRRNDVLEKLDLLNNKYVQDMITQLQFLVSEINSKNSTCAKFLKEINLGPLEINFDEVLFENDDANNDDDDDKEINDKNDNINEYDEDYDEYQQFIIKSKNESNFNENGNNSPHTSDDIENRKEFNSDESLILDDCINSIGSDESVNDDKDKESLIDENEKLIKDNQTVDDNENNSIKEVKVEDEETDDDSEINATIV